MKLKFSLLVNDSDGEGRRGWPEYNSGIALRRMLMPSGTLYLTD